MSLVISMMTIYCNAISMNIDSMHSDDNIYILSDIYNTSSIKTLKNYQQIPFINYVGFAVFAVVIAALFAIMFQQRNDGNYVAKNDDKWFDIIGAIKDEILAHMTKYMNIYRKRTQNSKSGKHVHIGAGKLGLGLIIPSLIEKYEHNLIVIQRNSNSWKVYNGRDVVLYKINGKNVENDVKFFIVRCRDDWDYYWNNVNEKMILLVLSDDNELKSYIINVGTSFSCSLGKAMKPVLESLFMNENVRDSKRILFAGENNHDMCYDLKRELHNKVNIVRLMVDGICTQRHITQEYIDIEILIMKNLDTLKDNNNDKEVVIPPMHGKTVLYGEKLLVNGSHTTLAFMTLVKNNDNILDTPLIGRNNPKMDKNLYYWSLARLLILFNEYNTNTLYNATLLVKSILLYVNQTLKRFYSVNNNTVKRVLSGGIKNRYNTRLNNVNLFINCKFDSIKTDTLCNELLSSKGIKLEIIQYCYVVYTH